MTGFIRKDKSYAVEPTPYDIALSRSPDETGPKTRWNISNKPGHGYGLCRMQGEQMIDRVPPKLNTGGSALKRSIRSSVYRLGRELPRIS